MEQRLETLEAEAKLRRIIVEYANTLDARDYKSYVELFAEDGEWVGGLGAHKGRAAIMKMLIEGIGVVGPDFINASNFHMTSNPSIAIDGDRATATSMFLFWVRSGGDKPVPQPAMAGRYYDEFVKVGGEWKIAKRTAHNIIPWQDPNNPDAPDPGATGASASLTPNSVEARLQKVEDEQAIHRLLIEYSARLDAKDITGWVDVFTETGTWRNGKSVHTGPEELRALLEGLFGGVPPVDYMQAVSYQVIHGIRVDVDGDTAKAISRHTLFRRDENGSPKPALAGIYYDDLVRVNGEWKIQFRDDHPVIPSRGEWEAIREERLTRGDI